MWPSGRSDQKPEYNKSRKTSISIKSGLFVGGVFRAETFNYEGFP